MSIAVVFSSEEKLLTALREQADEYQVLCPALQDGTETYKPLNMISPEQYPVVTELLFKGEPPLHSPKALLFPQSQAYLKFKASHDQVELGTIPQETRPTVVLGVKACDMKAISIIDKVFLQEPVDSLYQQRRQQTVFISTPCADRGPNCLCPEFSAGSPQGADIVLKNSKDGLYLEAITPSGYDFLVKLGASEKGVPASDNLVPKPDALDPDQVKEIMEALYESEVWEELALACLGCGICTFYCPTCHCYDVKDYSRKNQGVRYRAWDSCMFTNFTNMAGGHNPRPKKSDRLKNRFFHKLNYFVKQHGSLACVGCGRCAKHCPAGISINSVLARIGVQVNV